MSIRKILYIVVPPLLMMVIAITIFAYGNPVDILSPKGEIAEKQKDLIVFVSLLALVVMIPVYTMLFLFAHKYHEKNKKAKYTPEWSKNNLLEFIWWAIPCIIIFIVAVLTWKSSHDLDPFKPINHAKEPLKVQVVSLQWKWLFIYPEQNIATVNFVEFPEDRPVEFEITSDAPMNSFWIPRLGGQIYAMSGMSTKLNLIADQPGDYNGVSANISGEGFAGMNFIARASSEKEFETWVQSVERSEKFLSMDEYNKLAKPSKNVEPIYYGWKEDDLYSKIVGKYSGHTQMHDKEERH